MEREHKPRSIVSVPGFAVLTALASPACGRAPEELDLRTHVQSAVEMRGLGPYPGCSVPDVPVEFSLADAETAATDDRLPPLLASIRAALPTDVQVDWTASLASSGTVHVTVSYGVDGNPLCEGGTLLHLMPDKILTTGMPKRHALAGASLPWLPAGSRDWPDVAAAAEAAAASMGLGGEGAKAFEPKACVHLGAGGVAPGWSFKLKVGAHRYNVLAGPDGLPLRVEASGFGADGVASVYRDNPKTGQVVEEALKDLVGDGTLKSSRFTMQTTDGTEAFVAADLRFVTTPDDARFDQAGVFANSERMMAWMLTKGHGTSIGCGPIDLILVSEVVGPRGPDPDNARYTPPDDNDSGLPKIEIAPGVSLPGLRREFDVVAHELGHHFLYRALQQTVGETRSVHEGFADYFVFAFTGDPCLAESICVAGSPCAVESQCLRTAANSMKLEEAATFYDQASVISGMLWGLGGTAEIGHPVMARLAFRSLPYMLPKSGFADMLKGVLAADLELYDGSHACQIHAAAVARGFGEALQGVECKDFVK